MQPPVQRAIELLKIHQMRRENTTIYQSIQDVQDGIKELKSELDHARRLAQEAQNTAREAKDAAWKTANDVSTLGKENRDEELLNEVRQEVIALRGRFERAASNETSRAEAMFVKVNALENELSRVAERQRNESAVSATVLTRLEQMRVDFQLLPQLQNRMQGLTEKVESLPRDQVLVKAVPVHPQASILINRSQEESNDPILTLNNDGDPNENTEMESIDLDKHVATASFILNARREVEAKDALSMIPNSVNGSQPPPSLDTLRQRPRQSLASYLAEAQHIIDANPTLVHGTAINHFIEGLTDEARRTACETWLDTEGWSWDSILAFVNGVGIEQRDVVPSARILTSAGFENETSTSVSRAECKTLSQGTWSKRRRIDVITKDVGYKPRRSQRLLDQDNRQKSQQAGDPGRQLSPHAESAATRQQTRGLPEPGPCDQRKRAPRVKPPQVAKPEGLVKRDKKGRWKSQGKARSDRSKPATEVSREDIGVLGAEADDLSWARTPTTAKVNKPDATIQPNAALAFSNLVSRPMPRRTVTNTQGSPIPVGSTTYRSKVVPKLVPAKRTCVNARLDKHSDEDTLLPRQPRTPKKGTDKPSRQHRRGPLPPPPEIPILPTSDEEDNGRFDRWNSLPPR